VTPTAASLRPAAAAAVLCLVNAERAKRGLTALTASSPLTTAAAFHSTDMVRRKYFSHVAPGGLDVRRRVARTGYLRGSHHAVLGETIVYGSDAFGSPAGLVEDLMRSRRHRAIILGRYHDIGVGLTLGAPIYGRDNAGSTLSLNFGRR